MRQAPNSTAPCPQAIATPSLTYGVMERMEYYHAVSREILDTLQSVHGRLYGYPESPPQCAADDSAPAQGFEDSFSAANNDVTYVLTRIDTLSREINSRL